MEDDRSVPPAERRPGGRARSDRAARGRPGSSRTATLARGGRGARTRASARRRPLLRVARSSSSPAARAASESNASARCQTRSSPSRCAGRREKATWTSSNPSEEYRARRLRTKRASSRGDLVLPAEDVAVVLDELSEAEEPVEGARRLVPVHEAELREAQRQLARQRRHPSHELHVSRTADRLQRPGLALHHEHPLAEDAPVAAPLPDRLGEDLGAAHLAVALPADDPPDVLLEGAEQLEAARVPEHAARRPPPGCGTAPGGGRGRGDHRRAAWSKLRWRGPGDRQDDEEGLEHEAPRRNHGRDGTACSRGSGHRRAHDAPTRLAGGGRGGGGDEVPHASMDNWARPSPSTGVTARRWSPGCCRISRPAR